MLINLRTMCALALSLGCAILPAFRTARADDDNCKAMHRNPPNPVVLDGVIRDATTGAPVAGALVHWTIEHVSTVTGTASSDVSGRFSLKVSVGCGKHEDHDDWDHDGDHDSWDHDGWRGRQQVNLKITRNGYQEVHVTARVSPGSNPPLPVVLKPDRIFSTISGEVTGPDGQGIGGALVSVLLDGFLQPGLSAITGDDGAYLISHVGYGRGLTLSIMQSSVSPTCVKPMTRSLRVNSPRLTENFTIPSSPKLALTCAPVGEGSPGGPTIYNGAPLTLVGSPRILTGNPVIGQDTSIQWSPASIDGILMNQDNNVWHSGHINDILKIGPVQALVASDSSGVWSVAWSSSSAAALPLSTNWDTLHTTSLAQGPDGPAHIYASTSDGALWETDTSQTLPLLSWVKETIPNCNNIPHILVIPGNRLIVAACDTGVYWSTIPAAPAAHGTYNWQQAVAGQGVPAGSVNAQFARLAMGPGWGKAGATGTIAASLWGGSTPYDLIFWGAWVNNQLVLNAADVQPGPNQFVTSTGRTSLASCPTDQNTMYAMGDDPTGDSGTENLAAVWKSSDGGKTWNTVNPPPNGSPSTGATGHQGEWNQALAVSAAGCNTVALAWSYGSFVSFDGGQSWPMILNGNFSDGHLHDDYHALTWDPNDAQTLWIGSDGGMASASGVSQGGTPTYASYYNSHLYDLEFYHASPSVESTLVAGPLQDNSEVYSVAPAAWQPVPGTSGDGAYSEFTGAEPLDVLAYVDHSDTWKTTPWQGANFGSASTPPAPGASGGLGESVSWNVRRPYYSNAAGELMYVVDGSGSNVYGLFGHADGTDMHWESIGTIGAGENVTAVSSANGTSVFVGTDQGNICQLTQPYTGSCQNFTVNQSPASSITGVLEFFTTIGMATTASGNVLVLDGGPWQVSNGLLPGGQAFLSVDGPDLGSVFVTNGQKVFVTHDFGTTWLDASQGLPVQPNAGELHFQAQQSGDAIYLSTYGWSIYQANLP